MVANAILQLHVGQDLPNKVNNSAIVAYNKL